MALARPEIALEKPSGPVTVTSTMAGRVGASCAAKEKLSPVSNIVPGLTASGTTKASIASPARVMIGPPLGPPLAP